MKVVLLVLALFSGPLARAEPEVTYDYSWIEDGGQAVGCVEKKAVRTKSAAECKDVTVPDLGCAVTRSEEVVKDVNLCRKKLPVQSVWLKGEGFMDCVQGAKMDDGHVAFIRHLHPEECDHVLANFDTSCRMEPSGNLLFHPSSHFSVEDLIPEIMNLAEGGTVPPEVYKKYDSRRIGLTITYKIYQNDEKKTADAAKHGVDFMNGSQITMAFKHEYIDGIAEKGFLNQHQLMTSGGCLCPAERAIAENTFLGYKLEDGYKADPANPANSVRPKYSYFSMPNLPADQDPMVKSDFAQLDTHYGNVFAVFNPEVKDRATFTMTDSLGAPRSSVHTDRYRSDDPSATAEAGVYMEAQIWGDLAMKDVHHFIVNCEGFTQVPADALEKLKKLGRPIYNCKIDRAPIPPMESTSTLTDSGGGGYGYGGSGGGIMAPAASAIGGAGGAYTGSSGGAYTGTAGGMGKPLGRAIHVREGEIVYQPPDEN